MDLQALKAELVDFYWNKVNGMSDAFREEVYPLLDGQCGAEMNGY